ncbi:MAG: XrtA/PEP-CTERM system histidine kinase PrsK, partial [Gammaproteobacteria bacterium]
MNLGFYGYLAAAIAYGFFTVLLLFSWRESLQGKLLFITVAISTIWSVIAVKISLHDESYLLLYQVFEIVRYIAWYIFLLKLFDVASPDAERSSSFQRFSHKALFLSVGIACLFLINELLAKVFSLPGQFVLGITGNVLLALIGLVLVEQLYRNTSARFRWASKYMFIGVGGIFAFDFYLYSDALLFRSIDQSWWESRGIVHLVAVPLLAISSARNKNWSLNVFVSRDIVLNTSAILAGGFYLLAMAATGYYIQEFGGSWGKFGQVMFISLAVVFLFVLASSARLRAQIKVFLVKHFYKNKYDYRIEWLRLTEDLAESGKSRSYYRTAIKAMAHIVDARAGSLWLYDENKRYRNAGSWHSG